MPSHEHSAPRVAIHSRVRGKAHSATVAMHSRAGGLVRQGRNVYRLGFGQSPFPVPEPVVQSLCEHARQKAYLPVHGLGELRAAVAEYHRRDGLDSSSADVLIGPGSKELMFLLQLVFDGELVIPAPSWVSYAPQALLMGKPVCWLSTRATDGWRLRAEVLVEHCAAEPKKPRLLILNSPQNPAGTSFARAELAALAEVARTYRIVVLSDEIYGELHHRGAHESMAHHYPEGTIISSGLSKWCGAGGWRLGTFVFPPGLRPLLEAMATVASEMYTSTSAPIQYAAVCAFAGGPDIARYLAGSRRILISLGRHVTDRLHQMGAACAEPDGGFYVFPDFGPYREALAARGVTTGRALCEALLAETGVALLPGSEFGRPEAELTCRLAYVDFDGAKALEAVAAVPEEVPLDQTFLRATCGRVCEAMEQLEEWLHEDMSRVAT